MCLPIIPLEDLSIIFAAPGEENIDGKIFILVAKGKFIVEARRAVPKG
jgi:hypothetical protein